MRDPKNPFADRAERRAAGATTSSGGVSLDVLVTPDQYLVEVDLPGVALEDIELAVEDSELTIRAVRRRGEQTATKKDYAFLERKFGEIDRTIVLPGVFGVVAKTLENGVLTLVLPRKGAHEQLS